MPTRTKLDDASPYLRTLVTGDAGTGKTTSIAHAANHGDLVIIDAEAGVMLEALSQFDINTSNIEIYRWAGRHDLDELVRELRTDPPFAVAIDSVTELHELYLAEAGDERRSSASRDDSEGSTLKDHGTATGWHKALMRDLRSLECHVLWSSLEQCKQDDDSVMVCGPSAPTKMAQLLRSQPDQGIRFDTVSLSADPDDEPWHIGLTKKAGQYWAKDRTKTLPRVLPNPTFDRIWDYFCGELTESTDPVLRAYESDRATHKSAA